MPLGKISLDSILGLNTERNDTSGINPPAWSSMGAWAVENASSGATSPDTLIDCSNIIISRNKQAAARPAFTEVWDFTSTYGNKNGFSTKGMYAIPNSTTNSLIFSWTLEDMTDDADIANFATSSNQQMKSTVYYIGGAESNNFSSFPYLKSDFGWPSASVEFPIISFNISHFLTSYTNIYVFSSNGVFRTSNDGGYLRNITNVNYNKFKRVTLPLVKSLSAQITASPSDENRWFNAGSLVDFKILVTDQLSGTQSYQGKPSRTLTLRNTSTKSSAQITFIVDNTNIDFAKGGVAVYRTQSYLPGQAPPTVFKKCWESALSKGTTSTSTTTFTNIELTLNDTSIFEFQELYVDLNVESAQSQILGLLSAESAAPPTARDVITYNNFTAYGNLMIPPFAAVTMISLPNTDGLDKLKVGATSVLVSYVQNSITTPADTGVITTVSGTFLGLANNPNNTTPSGGPGYHLVIRPQDPNDATKTAGTYSVPWTTIADSLTATVVSGITFDIQVQPAAGELFSVSDFPATGLMAVLRSKTDGYIYGMFSYQSFDGSGTGYKFTNCLAFGQPFSSWNWTDATGFKQAGGKYVMYPLKGTNITALSTYAINTLPGSPSDTSIGFSLLPTYECYPTRLFNQNPVGNLTDMYPNNPSAVTWDPILGTINFIGIYALLSADLLDQCVRTLCDTYNLAKIPEDPYAVYDDSPTAPVGRIRFESIFSGYNRFSSYTTNSSYNSGEGFYDQITALSFRDDGAAPTVKYAEPIPISTSGSPQTQSNIMQQKVQIIAGIALSKFNKPEEIPIYSNLTPSIIGDPLKPIIKMINQYNQLLVFKQNEGTYRLDVQGQGAGIVPAITSQSLVDNTAWLLLPDSVQVFEGTAIYFSNKGFVSISPTGSISEMGPTIATETLNAYNIIAAAGNQNKVRSWTITQSRLYCCYFPYINADGTSQTYVFNFSTAQWTKWSGEISDVAVSAEGQLTLVEDIFALQEVVETYDQLQSAEIDPTNKIWSVIRQADFQNPSITQIEDTLLFAGLTVTNNPAISTITITGFSSTTPYSNLYNALMLFKNRTFWYFSSTNGYNLSTLVGSEQNVSITLQIVDSDGDPIIPFPFTPSSSDNLVTTVNSALYFNKFFISAPRGSTLSHFNEVQIYTQEGIDYSNLRVGFNSTGPDSNFVITSDDATPPDANVVTTSGEFVVTNYAIDQQFAPYYTLIRSQYVFRVLIPLNAGRGRFVQIAIKHDTPEEIFILNSLVYIYRDTTSTKIKAHS